jgi:hypothetical protein
MMKMLSTSFMVSLLDHPFLFCVVVLAALASVGMLLALIHATYDFILRMFKRMPMPPMFGGDDDEEGGYDGEDPVPMEPPTNGDELVYTNTTSERMKDGDYFFNENYENEMWKESQKWE